MPLSPPPHLAADRNGKRAGSLPAGSGGQAGTGATVSGETMRRFVESQVRNARRHAGALRPFRRDEFGQGPVSPSPSHLQAANRLIEHLRGTLLRQAGDIDRDASGAALSATRLRRVAVRKEHAARAVNQVEKVWDFYLQLFGQRRTALGSWLHGIDQIALDCYQAIYTGLGKPRPIPSPPPYSCMEVGFTPATSRRGILLPRLGRVPNPFPVISLPYHRLVNPWTLGAVHHEVAHNLQADLDLWEAVPVRIGKRLRALHLDSATITTWQRWHKEIWADLGGVLLGGPALVGSLLDLLTGGSGKVMGYKPDAVHPVGYLRLFITLELLRRMGFEREANDYARLWKRLYPPATATNLPRALRSSFIAARKAVVQVICFDAYPQLGDKSLADVAGYKPTFSAMVEESGGRLAAGVDPGVIPERLLVGAARWAVERRLAPPGRLTTNFYEALSRR